MEKNSGVQICNFSRREYFGAILRLFMCFILLLSNSQLFAQSQSFKSLSQYDIRCITFNDKAVCEPNGFSYGFVDYGIYKTQGFYFAIQNDNAIFGSSISLMESVKHTVETKKNVKVNKYYLVDMNNRSDYFNCRFWEYNNMIYLTLQKEGDKNVLCYVLTPKK